MIPIEDLSDVTLAIEDTDGDDEEDEDDEDDEDDHQPHQQRFVGRWKLIFA